ncbi:hypothetical protein MBLNU230_g8171t1 [Neophaeotheca triangularis]
MSSRQTYADITRRSQSSSPDTATPATSRNQSISSSAGSNSSTSSPTQNPLNAIQPTNSTPLASRSPASFLRLPQITTMTQTCPICRSKARFTPKPRFTPYAIPAEKRKPGLVIRIPHKNLMPATSHIHTQPGKNRNGFGHPAVTLLTSPCGHMVYCQPVTSFRNKTLEDKYPRDLCNAAKRWETLTDYVRVLHGRDYWEPSLLPVLEVSMHGLEKQSYVHLDFGFWVEWEYVEFFCNHADFKADEGTDRAEGAGEGAGRADKGAGGAEGVGGAAKAEDRCKCGRELEGNGVEVLRDLVAVNVRERAAGLRNRSEKLGKQPRKGGRWQPSGHFGRSRQWQGGRAQGVGGGQQGMGHWRENAAPVVYY